MEQEGFIHCSTADQYTWVANQRFRGRLDLVLLHIDPARLRSEVRYENLEGGTTLFDTELELLGDIALLRREGRGEHTCDSSSLRGRARTASL